jgi:hypothetical protein
LERIEKLCNTCNLQPREREFLKIFCSPSARAHEGKAHTRYFNAHYDNAIKHNNIKQFNELIAKYSYMQRLKYSLKRINIVSPSNQSNFINRLLKRLYQVKKHINIIELVQTDKQYYNYLMTTNRSIQTTDNTPKADLLHFTNTTINYIKQENGTYKAQITAPQQTHNSVIKWTISNQPPQPITEQEKEQAELDEKTRQRKVKALSKRLNIYKTLRDSNPYNNNGVYNAKFSAFTFFEALTEQEQLATAKAEIKAEAEAKKHIEALKKKPTISMQKYLEMVYNATAEEKKAIQDKYYITLC